MPKLLSIIIPVYNEENNIPVIYGKLDKIFGYLKNEFDYELIFIDDGSVDASSQVLDELARKDVRVKCFAFSRNFGKEVALTAGLHHSNGEAAIMIDADLQHPPELIPEFLAQWEKGTEIVIGIRQKHNQGGLTKKIGSWLFYKIIDRISETQIIPNATDYRLLDRAVINEFNKLTERSRMTRGLIDWLGFRRDYIYFESPARQNGEAGYSFRKLVRLALSSIISLSLFPLKLAGYLGIFITLTSGILGLFMLIEDYILNQMDFSGPAILAVMILFLIGIVLICLGLIALYIATIHQEVINRPMYVIRQKRNF